MITEQQKADAIAILDAEIPVVQSLEENGRYVQVQPHTVDGVIVGLTQYLAPERETNAAGPGYIRYVIISDADQTLQYDDHVGPEDRPSGWRDVTPEVV